MTAHWGKDLPGDGGFGAVTPFLVKTVLLRTDQFAGAKPVRAPAKDLSARPMTLRERATKGRFDVAISTNAARLAGYAGKANRPAAVLVMLTDNERVSGIFEFTEPMDEFFIWKSCGMAIAMDAEQCVLFMNEAMATPAFYLDTLDILEEPMGALQVDMAVGGIVGRKTWWSGISGFSYGYDGRRVESIPRTKERLARE